MFCGQTNQNFKFFWENMDTVLDLRGEGLSGLLSTLITTSVPTELAACASGKASNNAEKWLPHPHVFLKEGLAYFIKTILNDTLHLLQHCFIVEV